jgi:uncharacterized protein (DUF1697 family)
MNTYISMLRGINVSGQKRIRMAELKSLYESLGLESVQTYVQSGNVVFESEEQDTEKIRKSIEAQIEANYGFSVPILIRTSDDFLRLIGSKHFRKERSENPTRVMVTFLFEQPEHARLIELSVPENDTCEFVIADQEIFLHCPNGYGRSKLSNNFFEKKLGVVATTRNWKSVNALYEIVNQRQKS